MYTNLTATNQVHVEPLTHAVYESILNGLWIDSQRSMNRFSTVYESILNGLWIDSQRDLGDKIK